MMITLEAGGYGDLGPQCCPWQGQGPNRGNGPLPALYTTLSLATTATAAGVHPRCAGRFTVNSPSEALCH